MRPVRRRQSPQPADFANYEAAKAELISRMGRYCSYCERPILTILAVEHIQPKGLDKYKHLEGRWENFLLACVNCNSNKAKADIALADVLLPDRDNTFAAFIYSEDGKVSPAPELKPEIKAKARRSLRLTGLDRALANTLDQNGALVRIDRVSQRMQVWSIAREALSDVALHSSNEALRRQVIENAKANGFFSIWMAVFAGNAGMRNRLIDAFAGTRESGCFHPTTTAPVSPAPNPDGLPDGGKL